MTKVFRILQLKGLGLPQGEIASSCAVSKSTVSKVLKKASELGIALPLWRYCNNGLVVPTYWICGIRFADFGDADKFLDLIVT